MTDREAEKLAELLEKNDTIRVVNVETNLITPTGIVRLIKSLLKLKSVEEFRASNQVRKNHHTTVNYDIECYNYSNCISFSRKYIDVVLIIMFLTHRGRKFLEIK